MSKPKILLAYQHYPLTFGQKFKAGFQGLGYDVSTIGHTTMDEIPWVNPDTGRPFTGLEPDIPDIRLPEKKHRYEPQDWVQYADDFDLVVNIDAMHHFVGTGKFKKVIVGTDPHAVRSPSQAYPGRREDCDYFVCMQNYYKDQGDYFVPFAYESGVHVPQDPPLGLSERNFDVMFVGIVYQSRMSDLNFLREHGVLADWRTGILGDKYVRPYWNAKLAYTTPSMMDLPARVFENMAIGTPIIMREVPDMETLGMLPWVHYVPANSPDELVENTRKILQDPDLWESIRSNALAYVKPHNWERRAEQILQIAGFLEGDYTDFKVEAKYGE